MKKASAAILYFFALTLCLSALVGNEDLHPYFDYYVYLTLVVLGSGSFVLFSEHLTLAIPVSVSTIAPMAAPFIMSYNSQTVAVEVLLSVAVSALGVTIALVIRAIFRLVRFRRN